MTKEEISRLQTDPIYGNTSSVSDKVNRLFYLLHRDLLGCSVSGMILEKKSIRECFHCDKDSFPAYNTVLAGSAVTTTIKVLLWIVLLLLLIVQLAYILYFARQSPSQLQRAWLYSFYVFICGDCVLISTTEVLFTHIYIPSLLLPDIHIVRTIIAGIIHRFNSIDHYHHTTTATTHTTMNIGRTVNPRMIQNIQQQLAESDNTIPSISEFFFVSSRLAQYYNELPIARLALTYATMLPPSALFSDTVWWKPLYRSLEDSELVSTDIPIHNTSSRHRPFRTVFNIFVIPILMRNLFQSYMYSSVQLQDMLIQLVVVVCFSVVAVITNRLFQISPYLIVTPVVVLVLGVVLYYCAHWVYRSSNGVYLWYKTLHRVAPQTAAAQTQQDQADSAAAGVHLNSSELFSVIPAGSDLPQQKQQQPIALSAIKVSTPTTTGATNIVANATSGTTTTATITATTTATKATTRTNAILEHQRRTLIQNSAMYGISTQPSTTPPPTTTTTAASATVQPTQNTQIPGAGASTSPSRVELPPLAESKLERDSSSSSLESDYDSMSDSSSSSDDSSMVAVKEPVDAPVEDKPVSNISPTE